MQTRYAKFVTDDLRDVITIIQHEDGRLVVMSYDKITHKRYFIDDFNDVAIDILDREGIAIA
jgi:hypothetical protein